MYIEGLETYGPHEILPGDFALNCRFISIRTLQRTHKVGTPSNDSGGADYTFRLQINKGHRSKSRETEPIRRVGHGKVVNLIIKPQ